MNNDFNNDSMLELYLFEASTLLDNMEELLLQAESERALTVSDINEIFRLTHTIKGSSTMMSYDIIAETAHSAEDLCAAVRETGVNEELFDDVYGRLNRALDFLKEEVRRIQNDEPVLTAPPSLIQDLDELTGKITAANEELRTGPKRRPMPGAVPEMNDTDRDSPQPGSDTWQPDAEPNTWYIRVHFNEGARMENIRAYMLADKLNETGTVNSTIPAELENNPDASNTIIEDGFYISYTAPMSREQLDELLRGSLSVESVSYVGRMPDEADAPAPEPPLPSLGPDEKADTPSFPPLNVEPEENEDAEPIEQTAQSPASISGGLPSTRGSGGVQSTSEPMTGGVSDKALSAAGHLSNNSNALPRFNVGGANIEKGPISYDESTALMPDMEDPGDETTPGLLENAALTPDLHPASSKRKPTHISVELDKFDALMGLVEELSAEGARINEATGPDSAAGLDRRLNKLAGELRDSVISMRMAGVDGTFRRAKRLVDSMAKQLGKNVEILISGENMEVDKSVLNLLEAPIMHLLRNAVDHGIEPPDTRVVDGKSRMGHIILSARDAGDSILISVTDDGRGIDRDRVIERANSLKLLTKPPEECNGRDIFDMISAPGFTTLDAVTPFSGRGVGLDVVRANVEGVGGSVTIESSVGAGTRIVLDIPVTIAVADCLSVEVGDETFSIPLTSVKEVCKAAMGQLMTGPAGVQEMAFHGVSYPIVRLHEVFGIKGAQYSVEDGMLILTESDGRRGCILADRLNEKNRTLIKSLPSYLSRFPVCKTGVYGYTLMENGKISLVVDVRKLI